MISGMRRLSGNRQNCSLYIRLFADELQSIKDAAAREGESVSEYVRSCVLASVEPGMNDKPKTVRMKEIPAPARAYQSEDPLPTFVPNVMPPIAQPDKEWSETDKMIARKNAHALGCECIYCDRIREMFKEKKPAAAPAEKKIPPKKRKR